MFISRLLPLRLLLLLSLLGGFSVSSAFAQVRASLLAEVETVAPRQPFYAALRLEHEGHWHTYWLNPGTGFPTSIEWDLPEGWTAGEIEWPAPAVLRDRHGTVIGNGYEGVVLLPVKLTPPKALNAGERVTLRATADWLMCEEVCIPGGAELALELRGAESGAAGGAAAPSAAAGAIREAVANLPRALPEAWEVSATRSGDVITLALRAVEGPVVPLSAAVPLSGGAQVLSRGAEVIAAPSPALGAPALPDFAAPNFGRTSAKPGAATWSSATARAPHFFADDNLVGYDLPQQVAPDGQGGYVLTLAVSPDMREEPVGRLTGVLLAPGSDHAPAGHTNGGWLPDGGMPGLRIDVPLETGSASAGAAAAASGGLVGATGSPQSGSGNSATSAGFLATAALAFVGGLILNLMPCVFPVLGIKILGFVNQAGSERGKVVAHGLVFTLGVLLSFWTLAGVLAVLRAGGEQLGWGFQLQAPGFVFALAVLLLVFAMNLSGIFEFGLGATGLGAGLQTKSGLSGSFFTGVLATVVATPCSAPFLAPALGAALAMPVGESFGVFTAIAIGLSAPYLLLSIFPKAVGVLPRPGAWMETFKQFMAFPLYATVGYLLWVLAGQASENALLLVFFGLVVVALGLWCYGRLRAPGASAGRARAGLVGGVALLAAGLWLGWPQPPAPTELVWEPWSEELVAKYQREGRVIYLDFTARWCATCQTNKRLVFSSGEVLKTFANKNVAALKADWTSKDPKITAELAKYQKSAIPFNLVYLPGEAAPRELPALLTPSIVLDALK